MPLARAAALLGLLALPGAAAPVPEEILSSWPSSESATRARDWEDVFFTDERGESQTLHLRPSDRSVAVPVGTEIPLRKDLPLFRLAEADPPDDKPLVSGASYKRATLTAYTYNERAHAGGGIDVYIGAPGSSLALRTNSRYVYNGVTTPPYPSGNWVVLPPKTKEALPASPFVNVGEWPSCMSWELSSKAYYGLPSRPFFERMHPVEVDLAMSEDGLDFGRSEDWKAASTAAESGDAKKAAAYVESIRGGLYRRAKRLAAAAEAPDDRLTHSEARFLACRVERMRGEFHKGDRVSDLFFQKLRSAKSSAAFVKAWRPFVQAEMALYVSEGKKLPGTGEEGSSASTTLDYEKLKTAAMDRTVAAVAAGGTAAASSAEKPPTSSRRRPRSRAVEDAGSWAEDLVK